MIRFPHAKINLGLQVLRLRPDGYRDIRTIMLPVPLFDVLEAVVDLGTPTGEVVMTHSGRAIPGDPAQDLCLKAVRAIATMHPLPGLRIHLHKVIPTGAGLGGGSSDGTHMLLLLNDLLGLGMNNGTLHTLASGLGSDCPFFLRNEAQLAEGRGEVLSPVAVKLSGWWLVLANPGTHVGTAEVYANTPLEAQAADLAALAMVSPDRWVGELVNSMETYVFQAFPEVDALRNELVRAGASYAAMSGSGSTVFGLFRTRPVLSHLADQVLLNVRL